ncbi:pyridine nucleotide transhydrogenase, putative [Plasmodium knowlesi strain H]|uniref:proton-translocating NAD(P)(+) transhydrogenase n=3 Tax=Plasmodium knowlesi TaxID=5850 RepID=A0A5K1V5G7_PLAKH|nr:NAD(P) transhydrogenase, putative [Plasmodium knowlesi strain H]OTN65540.1 putative Pyridine nucleotide transhydrogenase [Plasmodium knowlesi]CAA9989614.1 NAD(P) transhydrogenase, putative [Plasmodium knowlesi strain H]SBO22692.1 pyridine nucleotide transhydrogenase, putative [Plasmodium knowlesi strain H]SBO23260.1 pyridine nucleotide transhydrogenase, putative [Plasmodium knowlesi strain H]VVS79088.1 NAD(P) transhydrogenase, putative [Plasmodium knowlesi strain H]|eukprot:XP_002260340.1 pyridine nucleotide transhydrogenase, putative [Plasmodium knowlesi strain H]
MSATLKTIIILVVALAMMCTNCKSNLRNQLASPHEPTENSSTFFQIKLPEIIIPPISSNNGNYKNYEGGGNGDGWANGKVELSSYSFIPSLLNAVYLFSALCFILCLTGLNNHKTSKRGNVLGFIGIVAAIVVTFSQVGFGFRYELFFIIVIPAISIGLFIAHRVSMVQMPQLVALFHSFVGLAALFVGFSKYHSEYFESYEMSTTHLVELYLGTFIGAITFIGSLVAAGKLSGTLDSKSLNLKIKKIINMVCIIIIIIVGYYFVQLKSIYLKTLCLYVSFLVDSFLGFHLVASIGAADMPVVISALNSYSGFATAISGFLLHNNLLIIAGSLIGSSGAILSYIMCIGMNRDIFNIILGGWDDYDELGAGSVQQAKANKQVNSTTHKYVAENLINARNVVIVPGYGTAVSKCQRELAEICIILKSRNVKVNFAIHPVAGRMPGHLNVLLAEANVPYNIVKEMNEINSSIDKADIVLVVGANDIVNPSSLDPSSKIYGMPIIEAWKSKQVIILKRTLNTGYSAIDNPLFYFANSYMLFGDAKYSTSQILTFLSDYTSHKYPDVSLADEHLDDEKDEVRSLCFLSEGSSAGSRGDLEALAEKYPKARRVIGLVKEDTGRTQKGEEKNGEAKNGDGKGKNTKEGAEETAGTPGSAHVNLSIVPLTPKFVPKLKKMGFRILVEEGIGTNIMIEDQEYVNYGAEITSKEDVLRQSNIILKVDPPSKKFIVEVPNNTVLISYLWPSINKELLQMAVQDKEKNNITYMAIDEVPRSTRAQKIDIRSSMSNLQGYRAVIEAFFMLPKFCKSSTTAAGKINPAKVFVIGAGVAGLQAIITAKSMGSIVYSHDKKASTEEEVKSCGGIFIKIPSSAYGEKNELAKDEEKTSQDLLNIQSEIFKRVISKCDILICSASVPGKMSPKLVTTEMIKLMKRGSVAVDLSTEFGDKESGWGGNIECSESNKNIIINGVHVLGRDKIERNMPLQASDLFSMNMINLLDEMGGGLQFTVDTNNDIVKALVVVKDGKILYSPDRSVEKLVKSESIFLTDQREENQLVSKKTIKYPTGTRITEKFIESDMLFYISLIFALMVTLLIGTIFSQSDLHHLFLFTLSIIVGYFCVWSVTPSLHTPLMSVTNALSGVIIIGSMIEYGSGFKSLSSVLSMIATFLSAVNLSGGFYVTKRMLDMFIK